MITPRLFVCSSYELLTGDSRREGREVIELDALGIDPNVHIRIEDVARVFLQHLSPRLLDLIEIASYVYSADCSTQRGTAWTDEKSTEAWSRDFRFVIPVREPDFWRLNAVNELLTRALNFLSDDKFSFDFEHLQRGRATQEYLDLGTDEEWPFYGVERVVMFSGGLDSLAGAVSMAAKGEKLVLVSHRPVATLSKRQRELFQALKDKFCAPMIHIPVWINKDKELGREHTQRTRSFLFSALGAVIAYSVQAQGVRFFENGVVSLNLPVADEVLRARASRTTHPLALSYLTDFFSLVFEYPFVIDNPFLFHTKTDVISEISNNNSSHLIRYTCSCAHTGFYKSKTQWHCGTCSQCIDRRIAIIAANQGEYDPEVDYVENVFFGARKEGYEQNMAINYVRHGIELNRMSEEQIGQKFSFHLTRAARPFSNRREVIERLVELHKRHGQIVADVVKQQLQIISGNIVLGEIEQTSMMGLVVGQEHLTSSWKRFADRITVMLQNGVPTACQSIKPKNEPHLQEICDGILQANENVLVREFPFMKWSSSATKPDWSAEALKLWVELKYVREKSDIRTITEDISSDITKYGDNNKRVLFVVYDPNHHIVNEQQFSRQIVSRETMTVAFIR